MISLKNYCKSIVPFLPSELDLIDNFFVEKTYNKKEFILENGKICNFIAFIDFGTVRHFHIKDGVEKTCDISFENAWITDFQSFTNASQSIMNLQTLEKTCIYLIEKQNLIKLYETNPKFETFGRLMAEKVAQRATDIAMSLSSEKPEERFQNLIKNQPEVFQRVPQKYIANFLGISPESLSRIQHRVFKKSKS